MPPLRTFSLKDSTVNGSEVLPCSNGSIVNSGANFVRLSPLAASKGLRWLCICKFNAFTLNGLINSGGRFPMLSTLILAITTLRQGYNIDIAAGLTGAIVKDPVQDRVVWLEYLQT